MHRVGGGYYETATFINPRLPNCLIFLAHFLHRGPLLLCTYGHVIKSSIVMAIQLHKYTLPISTHMGQCTSYETPTFSYMKHLHKYKGTVLQVFKCISCNRTHQEHLHKYKGTVLLVFMCISCNNSSGTLSLVGNLWHAKQYHLSHPSQQTQNRSSSSS